MRDFLVGSVNFVGEHGYYVPTLIAQQDLHLAVHVGPSGLVEFSPRSYQQLVLTSCW